MRTRMFLWGILVFVATIGAVSVPDADAAARVVGGSNAPAGSWPAIVALVTHGQTPSMGQFCGGTLIDPAWVLTAAHCITDSGGAVVSAASLDTVVGLTNLLTDTGQRSSVTSIVRDSLFSPVTLVHDVALLHLQTPAVLGPTVATMELVSPLRSDLWDGGSPAEIAGWGDTLLPPPLNLPNALQQAQVPIVSDATCAANLSSGPPPVFVSTAMVCAGPAAGGVDTCQGDSGGPLTVLDGTTRVLVGAVSWGVGCAQPNLPGVYTRLNAYRSFIFGSTGLNHSAPDPPTILGAVAGVESATVSWTPPAVDGGRAIETNGVRVVQKGIPGPLVPVQGNATQTTITGLVPGTPYTFTVLAANDVGIGPASAQTVPVIPTAPPVVVTPPAPAAITAPSISGIARVGRLLQADPGSWSEPADVQVAWQSCDASGVSCADIGGAVGTTFTPTRDQLGLRIRVRTTATNPGGIGQTGSQMTSPVRDVFAIGVIRRQKVSQTPAGRVTVTIIVRGEPGAELAMRIVGRRGKARPVERLKSRINGKIPSGLGRTTLMAIVPTTGVMNVRIVLSGAPSGPRRTAELSLTATDTAGENAAIARAFRARI